MARWTFYLCQATTGQVVGEVVPSTFTGKRTVSAWGDFSATINLKPYGSQRRRDLLTMTRPGAYTIVADRDGQPMGEWMIWKRARGNDQAPVALTGLEIGSYMDHREIGNYNAVGTEQLTIARDLVVSAFNPPGGIGAVAMNIPTPAASGVPRVRKFSALEATIGQRVVDLSNLDQGFDFTISYAWATSGPATLIRTFNLLYPQAGRITNYLFEMPDHHGSGGNATAFTLNEDATGLASKAWALGAGSGATQYIAGATNYGLTSNGYPFLETSKAWSNVARQDIIAGYSRSLLSVSQTAEMPASLTVLADADPPIGSYGLGDVVRVAVGESTNFPDGWGGPTGNLTRVLGWTLDPLGGGVEKVTLDLSALTQLATGNI